MSKKRTQYSSEFKAKIALAAIRGDETISQLAAGYGMHSTQINSKRSAPPPVIDSTCDSPWSCRGDRCRARGAKLLVCL
jgi:hypothetical protein